MYRLFAGAKSQFNLRTTNGWCWPTITRVLLSCKRYARVVCAPYTYSTFFVNNTVIVKRVLCECHGRVMYAKCYDIDVIIINSFMSSRLIADTFFERNRSRRMAMYCIHLAFAKMRFHEKCMCYVLSRIYIIRQFYVRMRHVWFYANRHFFIGMAIENVNHVFKFPFFSLSPIYDTIRR
jgi:hypothetical protein